MFINLYGLIEVMIYCICYCILVLDKCKYYNGMVVIGKLFFGICVIIVDEEGNELF